MTRILRLCRVDRWSVDGQPSVKEEVGVGALCA